RRPGRGRVRTDQGRSRAEGRAGAGEEEVLEGQRQGQRVELRFGFRSRRRWLIRRRFVGWWRFLWWRFLWWRFVWWRRCWGRRGGRWWRRRRRWRRRWFVRWRRERWWRFWWWRRPAALARCQRGHRRGQEPARRALQVRGGRAQRGVRLLGAHDVGVGTRRS